MIRDTLIDLFPLSIASGKAFCNRTEETERLKRCIMHHRPVLLVSPRRYGKTSLALHGIKQSGLPFAHIDFFSAVDDQDIEYAILRGIGKLISSLETVPKKALALAVDFFSGTHIRAVLSKMGISIEIDNQREKPSQRILKVLERLEKLSETTQQKLVLFFDEFQCIGEIADDQSMESVLRQVAQLTQSISFVFSGSNRHLLNQLFEDRKRPFYKLCERITIERIEVSHYKQHIQKAASDIWKNPLDELVFESLFACSERHPYYINLLCSRMFIKKEQPSAEVVENMWAQYVREERSSVASELDMLSHNQKKLLTMLAREHGTNAPLGQDFVQKSRISKATIAQALGFLEKYDYVEKSPTGQVTIIDPLIKTVLSGLGTF